MKENIRLFLNVIQDNKFFTTVLFMVMFLAGILEGVGFSLVLPFLNNLIGVENATDRISKTMFAISNLFPFESSLINLCTLIFLVFIVKSSIKVLQVVLSIRYSWNYYKKSGSG